MNVVIRSRVELLAWQGELLDQVGMGKERLYQLAQQWRLRRDERLVYETLRSIDWLLSDDAYPFSEDADLFSGSDQPPPEGTDPVTDSTGPVISWQL